MKVYIIGIFLIILGVISLVNGEATNPVQINSAIQSNSDIENDSTGRSILSAGFWFLVQQGLLISLITLATVYMVYTLIVPYAFGEIDVKRSLNNRASAIAGLVFKSVDPVDLTFGVLSIDGEQCRLRAVCQLRKTVAAMPMLQGYLDSYMPSISTMEKYSEALKAGEALEDCYRLFPDCTKDPYQKLPKFLQY